MSVQWFHVSIEGGFDLSVEDVWPDGGAPANPTAQDVAAVMVSCGSKMRVLADWELRPDVFVDSVKVDWRL